MIVGKILEIVIGFFAFGEAFSKEIAKAFVVFEDALSARGL